MRGTYFLRELRDCKIIVPGLRSVAPTGTRLDASVAHSCFPVTLAFSAEVKALLQTPAQLSQPLAFYLNQAREKYSNLQIGTLSKGGFILCEFVCIISLNKPYNYVAFK